MPSSVVRKAMLSDLERLAANVRARREALGMKGWEVAKAAGLDRSYVSSIENGTRGSYPKLSTLQKLANALRVDVDELSGRKPLPVPQTPYDTNPEYRELIDQLEMMAQGDRAKILSFAGWIAEKFFARDGGNSLARVTPSTGSNPTTRESGGGEGSRIPQHVAKAIGEASPAPRTTDHHGKSSEAHSRAVESRRPRKSR